MQNCSNKTDKAYIHYQVMDLLCNYKETKNSVELQNFLV